MAMTVWSVCEGQTRQAELIPTVADRTPYSLSQQLATDHKHSKEVPSATHLRSA